MSRTGQDKCPHGCPPERLYGTQEAASFLGIHRSTLHIAVRRGVLVPDHRTPGGHLRFRQDTLEAFRVRLVGWPATSVKGVDEPIHLLGDLAHLLAERRPLAESVAAVAAGVPRALPGVDVCAAARVTPQPHDRLALSFLRPCPLPQHVVEYFSRLRTTFKFASTTALRTQMPQICEDAAAETLFTGIVGLRRIWPIGAYAVLPIAACGEPLGVLICDSFQPRRFDERDQAVLRGVADLLALAIAADQTPEQQRDGAAIQG